MEEEPTLFVNASILTMDPETPRAEALLVQDGRITAVGSREELEPRSRGARSVDLGGQTVIPGFDDCHCHILSFGLDLERLNVSADAVRSIEDIERLVAQRAEGATEDEWILGRGYDQNMLREGRHPTRADLDQAARGRPVVLWHTSGHVLTCNSRALELAGITGNTATPAGGEIERDEHGDPTGVLKEAPAMTLLNRVIPPPTVEQGTEAILRGMQVMAEQGITSASDAATGRGDSIDSELQMYRGALASGRLAARITLMPQILFVAPPDSDEVHSREEFDAGNQPEWLAIGSTKIFSDGALSTRTAAVRQPYEGTDSTGLLLWEPRTLAGMIRRAHGQGWQIATHALGDRAIEVVLDGYEQTLAAAPRPDHRYRIEHCMMPDEPLVRRIKQLGVVPTIQPDIFRLGDGYISALGMDRAQTVIPMALFKRLGVPIAFSSDRPVVPGHPLEVIHDALIRRTPGGVVLGVEHRVTAEEAIRYYTAGSAYATHRERRYGTLRPGMMADFALLSADPTAISPEDFGEVEVTMTVVGGRIVFDGASR